MTINYRFVLDTNELDDAEVGLGAILVNAQRFTLDQSPLNDEGFLLDGDEYSFVVYASAVDAELGGADAQASAEVIITIVAIGSSELGALDAQASALVEHSASASSALGAVAGSANATITVAGSASGSLGAVSASATAGIDNPATGEAALGGVSSQASAIVSHPASGAGALGALSAEANGEIDNPATGEASLGDASAQASGVVSHSASAASSFQTITASGSALVIVNASGVTLIPAIDATAIGTVIPVGEAIADAELGSLDASASASVVKKVVGTGGVRWVQQLPPQPQIVAPKDDEEEVVELVVVREPVLVSGFASVVLGSVRARAVGGVSWIAEKDDEELLMML